MTETIIRLLTRLSEAGCDAILPGALAAPIYGAGFDRLLSRRILVERAPLTDWEVCDACECGLASRPIRAQGATFRADCPLDRRQDIVLTANDLRVFFIGAEALATAIGAAAGFGGPPRLIAAKVWKLGVTPSGRAVVLTLEAAALTGNGIAATLRVAVQGADITILAPDLPADVAVRLRDAGFHVVATLAVIQPAANTLGIALDAAALEPVPLAPVLRVRTASAEVLWRNRTVILSHQMFPLFLRLAQQ